MHAQQRGGYVIVVRHASFPDARPTAKEAAPGNAKLERQLDAKGKKAAQAEGQAIHLLHIPIGKVLSSPTYRARETARFAKLGKPAILTKLGEAGPSMQRNAVAAWAGWLRRIVAQKPAASTDTFIVTQGPNVSVAFGNDASGLKAGGALVLQPNAKGGATLVGLISITE